MSDLESVYVGIDPTSGSRSFTFAALDKDLHVLTLADGETEDVISYLTGQKSATVAVNAPAGVNRGLVRKKMKKEMPAPHQLRGAELRMAEYELRIRGIAVTGTAASEALCPAWVQVGFEFYRRVERLGFGKYPVKNSLFQVMETQPHACFSVMVGSILFSKPSLEGRLQRQSILYEHGVLVRDPMDFFEEITRYKLAKGIWPMELLYLPEQLDALVAAYTAWLAGKKDGKVIGVGDNKEGQIILPVSELKDKY
jgi:hypothetical protein